MLLGAVCLLLCAHVPCGGIPALQVSVVAMSYVTFIRCGYGVNVLIKIGLFAPKAIVFCQTRMPYGWKYEMIIVLNFMYDGVHT